MLTPHLCLIFLGTALGSQLFSKNSILLSKCTKEIARQNILYWKSSAKFYGGFLEDLQRVVGHCWLPESSKELLPYNLKKKNEIDVRTYFKSLQVIYDNYGISIEAPGDLKVSELSSMMEYVSKDSRSVEDYEFNEETTDAIMRNLRSNAISWGLSIWNERDMTIRKVVSEIIKLDERFRFSKNLKSLPYSATIDYWEIISERGVLGKLPMVNPHRFGLYIEMLGLVTENVKSLGNIEFHASMEKLNSALCDVYNQIRDGILTIGIDPQENSDDEMWIRWLVRALGSQRGVAGVDISRRQLQCIKACLDDLRHHQKELIYKDLDSVSQMIKVLNFIDEQEKEISSVYGEVTIDIPNVTISSLLEDLLTGLLPDREEQSF